MSLSKWMCPFTGHNNGLSSYSFNPCFHIEYSSKVCIIVFNVLHDFSVTTFDFLFLGMLPAVVTVFSITLSLLMLYLGKKTHI